MANPENLKPWKPGQSGNPAGSSKKQRLTNTLLRILEEKELDEPFIRAGLAAALKGDFQFWRYIFDRIDGPSTDADADALEEIVAQLLAGRRHRDDPGDVPE